jgi:hypothetical protein
METTGLSKTLQMLDKISNEMIVHTGYGIGLGICQRIIHLDQNSLLFPISILSEALPCILEDVQQL